MHTHQLDTHPKSNNQAPIIYTSAERTDYFLRRGTRLKKVTYAALDQGELKYAALLEGSGLSRSVARTIVCLMVRQDLTVREIALATQMSSALASIALRKLRENEIVQTEANAPRRLADRRYRLAGEWDRILARIEELEQDKVSSYLEKADKVRRDFREKYG